MLGGWSSMQAAEVPIPREVVEVPVPQVVAEVPSVSCSLYSIGNRRGDGGKEGRQENT